MAETAAYGRVRSAMVTPKDVAPPSGPYATSSRDTDFALLVGVDHYPRFQPLCGAIEDATRFHAWLCAPDGGGVRRENARLIPSTADPLAPLHDQVDDALEELLVRAGSIGGGRRLYFHFSGHGAANPGAHSEDVALLLAKWSRVRARLALSCDEYRGMLTAARRFDEIAVFLDCCRSTGAHVVGLPPTFVLTPGAGSATRTFVAYATEAGRSAFEARDHCAWQGVFTRSLLSILQRSPQGIEAAQLKRALEREVATRGQQAHVVNGFLEGSMFGAGGARPPAGTSPPPEPTGLRRIAYSPAGALSVTSDATVRITVYDGTGTHVASGYGRLRLLLPPGRYRVDFARFGVVRQRFVDHDMLTDLHDDGPPLITPALVQSAETSHAYYIAPARRFSIEDTCPVLGQPASSRIFVFARRRDRDSPPRSVPSEPLTIHDLDGRRLAELAATTAQIDNEAGYAALSTQIAPGTYRLRAGRSQRELAITIPPGRAAHVYIADRGVLAIDDVRVSLVPVDQPCDPESRSWRVIEDVLFALRAPDSQHSPDLQHIPNELIDEDLCLGLAIAHLAWRSRDREWFERIVDHLQVHDTIPDIAILRHASPQGGAGPALSALAAPPLFQASLTLALTHPAFSGSAIAFAGAMEQATRTRFLDSIWCTWSARAWDERWIEPTIEELRQQTPDAPASTLAQRFQLSTSTVERAIASLDSVLPHANGVPVSLDRVHAEGYQLGAVLGRGPHGVVLQATRQSDGEAVALKIVPVTGGEQLLPGVERELERLRLVQHPRLLMYSASGRLPGHAALWLEMKLCRGSAIDLLDDRDAPMAPAEARPVILEALEGLAALHHHAIVHRGIKPGNLLLGHDGHVSLGDVGLTSHLLDPASASPDRRAADRVRFAPREQLLGLTGVASDIWSMAATLYFMLTLELPRDRYADQSETAAALDNPVVPILERRVDLPRPLARSIDRALVIEPEARPADAAAFARELELVFRQIIDSTDPVEV